MATILESTVLEHFPHPEISHGHTALDEALFQVSLCSDCHSTPSAFGVLLLLCLLTEVVNFWHRARFSTTHMAPTEIITGCVGGVESTAFKESQKQVGESHLFQIPYFTEEETHTRRG